MRKSNKKRRPQIFNRPVNRMDDIVKDFVDNIDRRVSARLRRKNK